MSLAEVESAGFGQRQFHFTNLFELLEGVKRQLSKGIIRRFLKQNHSPKIPEQIYPLTSNCPGPHELVTIKQTVETNYKPFQLNVISSEIFYKSI